MTEGAQATAQPWSWLPSHADQQSRTQSRTHLLLVQRTPVSPRLTFAGSAVVCAARDRRLHGVRCAGLALATHTRTGANVRAVSAASSRVGAPLRLAHSLQGTAPLTGVCGRLPSLPVPYPRESNERTDMRESGEATNEPIVTELRTRRETRGGHTHTGPRRTNTSMLEPYTWYVLPASS